MSLHPHPTDARITCLTSEQLQQLATLHGQVLHPSGNPPGSSGFGSDETIDVDLRTRLVQLEAQVATLQTQLTDLTFQLLREREQRTEQRLYALEAQLRLARDEVLAPLVGSTYSSASCHFAGKEAERAAKSLYCFLTRYPLRLVSRGPGILAGR